jgi:hypothetical protein
MRIRSLRDRASRSDPIRSSESGDAIPDPDPDPMIGSFDPDHDSAGLKKLTLPACWPPDILRVRVRITQWVYASCTRGLWLWNI